MRRAIVIAGGELALMVRSRLAVMGLATLVLVSGVAAASSWVVVNTQRVEREDGQRAADLDFDSQPARHPHRMVHYGHFAFRPMTALSAFEPGVDPFTGTVVFLEGHRQNSAAFGAVRESSGLIHFGQLTPAFVLPTLAPLLLIFLGFACVARERDTGHLLLLKTHGARGIDIILGKWLALVGVAFAGLLPALVALGASAMVQPVELPSAVLMAVSYAAYLFIWCGFIVAMSSVLGTGRSALLALVSIWVITTVLLPRVAAETAHQSVYLPKRVESDLKIHEELRQLGDSHNPDDPYFNNFREKTLQQYGVERIEDLPFNYRGALSAEGEALTSRLFSTYAARYAAIQARQSQLMWRFSAFSPAIAVRWVSMAAAGTNLDNHLRFLEQAEAYRFDMVQRLNRLHANELSFEDDKKRSVSFEAEQKTRVSAEHWRDIPDFQFKPTPSSIRLGHALPAVVCLVVWLGVSIIGLSLATYRIERTL